MLPDANDDIVLELLVVVPLGGGDGRVAMVELVPEVAAEARSLLLKHALRAGDSIQLASGLYLQRQLARPLRFVVYDERLATTARAEGLRVVGATGASLHPMAETLGVRKPAGASGPAVPGDELPANAGRAVAHVGRRPP